MASAKLSFAAAFILTLVLFFTGCQQGSSNNTNSESSGSSGSTWDNMKWDQSNWQ